MKKTKIIIGIISTLLLGNIIYAQDLGDERSDRRNRKEKMENRRFGKLADELDLTATQNKEVYELIQESKEERKALKQERRGQEKPSKEERVAIKEQMKENAAELDTEIMKILNEDQRTKYQEMIAERQTKKAEREEKREAVRAYREENVKPVMHTQRLKLENSISAEDKQTIADLQTRINPRSLKGRKGSKKKGAKISEEDRETLKSLVQEYKDEIDALHEEIADEQEEWKAYFESMKSDDSENRPRGKERRQGRKRSKDRHKYVAFLLMDVAD